MSLVAPGPANGGPVIRTLWHVVSLGYVQFSWTLERGGFPVDAYIDRREIDRAALTAFVVTTLRDLGADIADDRGDAYVVVPAAVRGEVSQTRLATLLVEGRDAYDEVKKAGGWPAVTPYADLPRLTQRAYRSLLAAILRELGFTMEKPKR